VPELDVPDRTDATVLLATHADGSPAELRPWESRVYRL
jgi:hypothetical protein